MPLRLFAIASCVALTVPAASQALPFDCVIEPQVTVGIVAGDRARINEILVKRGDIVKAGDTLVLLESALESLQVDLYRARVESDVGIRASAAEAERYRDAYNRIKKLKARNAASAVAVEEAAVQLELGNLGVEQATIARQVAAIELEQAEARLERLSISSPLDAIVTHVLAAPGEYAHEQLEILRLAQIDPLRVEVFVTPEYYGSIAIDNIYEVEQVAPLSGRFPARVSVIDRVFDAASNTFGVRLEIDNPDGVIPAGTRCKISFD